MMCSYNAVNGVPMCANEKLLGSLLRDSWNFSGLVVSDCGAVDDIAWGHHFKECARPRFLPPTCSPFGSACIVAFVFGFCGL